MVLESIGDENIVRRSAENGLVNGCNRSEQRLGTNGIGTTLEGRKAIQVDGNEHYYSLHNNWVCSGAPIFYPDGTLAGAFCLTGVREKVSLHTLGMAVSTADAITRQLRMQSTYDELEAVQKNLSIIIETVPAAILLLDEYYCVRCSNAQAAHLLSQRMEKLRGSHFGELLHQGGIQLEELEQPLANRYLSFERAGRTYHLAISCQKTEDGHYVVQLEKADTLHRRVNQVVGSNARFSFEDIIGRSRVLTSAIHLARVAAKNSSNVLLTGESGTGKELFAQAIHNASDRRDGPFVAINCGALPKSLIESELFGYEEGSFTGSKRGGSPGKFELAKGGTIFLDEIGDMPFDVQVTLLRVLQNREISRVGSSKSIRIDVRIIAATNQDLLAAIQNNTFRSDLYYRLNVFNIQIPPLRERIGDIPLLADHFCHKYGLALGRELAPEALSLLEQYHWPGNIRELENVMERAAYLARESVIRPEALNLPASHGPSGGSAAGSYRAPLPRPEEGDMDTFSIRKNEQKQIENALRASGGNVKKAADLLGISRRTMYRKMDKYGIDCDALRRLY